MRVLIVDPLRGAASGGYDKYLTKLVPALQQCLGSESIVVAKRAPAAEGGVEQNYEGVSDLRAMVKRLSVDVVLVPTARPLGRLGAPTVYMVRNMEPFDHRHSVVQPTLVAKSALRRRRTLAACAGASAVIAVSAHVRDVLIASGVDGRKVSVVPHGVELPESGRRPRLLSDDRQFIFTAGSIRPARGLEDLFGAMELLPPHVILVIAGAPTDDSQRYARRLRARASRDPIEGRVVWAGSLSSMEMSWCFSHAAMYVSTSRAEACPNTLLEAMAHGTACLATNRPPMPEFLGNAGVFYAAGDGEALATAIEQVVNDGALRETLGQRALEAVSQRTWQRCAEQTAAALASAIPGGHPGSWSR